MPSCHGHNYRFERTDPVVIVFGSCQGYQGVIYSGAFRRPDLNYRHAVFDPELIAVPHTRTPTKAHATGELEHRPGSGPSDLRPASGCSGRNSEARRQAQVVWGMLEVGEDPAGVYGSLGQALERSSLWPRTAGRGPAHAASPGSGFGRPSQLGRRRLLLCCLGPGFVDVLLLLVMGQTVRKG